MSYLQASGSLETGSRLSQRFGADLSRADQNKFSGDADLPSKLPLADRRAKMDNVSLPHKQVASYLLLQLDSVVQSIPWCHKSRATLELTEP